VEEIVNEMASYAASENFVNPWNTANDLMSKLGSRNNGATMALQNCSHMNIGGVERQKVQISSNGVANAKLMVNGLELPYGEFDGYLFAPITLKAVAPVGFRFKGWKSTGTTQMKSVFATAEEWEYYDSGSLDGTSWKSSSYNDSQWKTGLARIGYDNNNWHTGLKTTTEGYLTTYYFRKSFNLADNPSATDEFILDYVIDDGMIVYINGVEAGRYNMPSGTILYNDVATTHAHNNPDTGQMTLKGSLFKKGKNVIAVEVHNNSTTSSDILWDASLSYIVQNNTQTYISTDEEYTLPSTGSQAVVAEFENLSDIDILAEGITPVRINEVSAANSIYINDYFKKNDWIELYNTTDADIDIKGMTISLITDKSKTEKRHDYQVPTNNVKLNTIIPAHGYKVVWCDKLDIIGADIHTNFKLETKGGEVIISTDSYTDKLEYEQHLGTETYGRYPDGANDVYVMTNPTIAKANMIGSYDTLYVKPLIPTPDAIKSYSKEGSIAIAYVGGVVNVKSEDAAIRSVDVYSMSGMKMEASTFANAGNRFVSVNVADLPKGIYIVKATTEDGDENHIKFIIK
jgi:hypothetical protein